LAQVSGHGPWLGIEGVVDFYLSMYIYYGKGVEGGKNTMLFRGRIRSGSGDKRITDNEHYLGPGSSF